MVGGSVAWGARRRGLAGEVVGVDVDRESGRWAVAHGVVDRIDALADGLRGADAVILAVPVGHIESVAREIAPLLDGSVVVTDVGSVKAPVVNRLEPMFPLFVGGHPMAGGERSGVEAASADLFEGARCVLTPTSRTQPRALTLVERLWAELGASVMHVEPVVHDELVAAVSHLPHLAAASLVNTAARAGDGRALALAAGGFRDTTRVASGSPELWRDICLMNRGPVQRVLSEYTNEINRLRAFIEREDGPGLLDALSRAQKSREALKGGEA